MNRREILDAHPLITSFHDRLNTSLTAWATTASGGRGQELTSQLGQLGLEPTQVLGCGLLSKEMIFFGVVRLVGEFVFLRFLTLSLLIFFWPHSTSMYLVLLGTSHFGLDFLDFVHSRHDVVVLGADGD